jgi:enolase
VAIVTAGISVGKYEVHFATGGEDLYGPAGVQMAVDNVNNVIAPAIMGMDATGQAAVDSVIIELDGTADKSRLGGNATASVSAAVLKAGAASAELPLYQHIGGVRALTLPVPGVPAYSGSRRYGTGAKSGAKPSVSFICFGFDSFSAAVAGGWKVSGEFRKLMFDRLGVDMRPAQWNLVSPGVVSDDRQLWAVMKEAIAAADLTGRVGIQMDVASATFYDAASQRYLGLFSEGAKTREEMIDYYRQVVAEYPFVIIEDPLDEDDYEGHAILAHDLGIEIVGDDLFTTNPARVRQGIAVGAANAVLLKVNQIGSISESFEMVSLAYANGYGVMPCDSRGEGVDICDYTVGLGCGHLREGGIGTHANRFMEIEAELGGKAQFAGKAGLKVTRWPQA